MEVRLAAQPTLIETRTMRKIRARNLGGFVAPYAMGAISKKTGNFHAGLVFAGISLLASAMLIFALRNKNHAGKNWQ
jgi:LPXTG-motif cell wall-anchored protein